MGLQGKGYGLVRCTHGMWPSLECPEQTNNRAELMACITALRVVPPSKPLQVVIDSKYVHDGATLST